MKKNILKIILYVVASLTFFLAAAILLVVLLIYGCFNNQITRVINSQSESMMNGRLTVGSLEGRLFEGFTLNRILVTFEDDTVIYAGSWQVKYNLRSLLHKKIHITTSSVSDVMVRMVQNSDSVWNLESLIPEPVNEPEDTTSSPFSWEIAVDDFRINHLGLQVELLDTSSLIPDKTEADIHLQFGMKENDIIIRLIDSQVNSKDPDVIAYHLSSSILLTGDSLIVEQFNPHLPQTQIKAQARLEFSAPENLTAHLFVPALAFDDFRDFMGELPLYGKPSLEFTAENRNYLLNIWNMNQEISLKGFLSGIDSLAHYSLNAGFKNLDIGEWVSDPELKSNITGTIEVSGTGLSVVENQLNTSASFPMLEFAGYTAALQMSARKTGPVADGRLYIDSKMGKIFSDLSLNDMFKLPVYQINAIISKINISEISGDSLLTSDLNFSIGVNGKGIHPEKIQIGGDIQSGYGTIAGIEMDTLIIKGQYDRGHYSLKEFMVRTTPFLLEAFGKGDINGRNDIGYQLIMKDVSPLGRFLGADSLTMEGFVGGTFSGTLNDAEIVQNIRLNNLKFNDIILDSLQVSLQGFIQNTMYSGTLGTRLTRVQLPGFQVDKLEMQSAFDGAQLKNELKIMLGQDIDAEALIYFRPDDILTLNMPQSKLIYKDNIWLGRADSISFNSEEKQVTASGISFESGDQKIEMGGSFSTTGSVKGFIGVENLDFAKLPLELFSGFKPEGRTNFVASLSGTAAAPLLESELEITGLRMDSLALDTIMTKISFDEDAFRVKGNVDGYGTSLLQFDGLLPYHFSFMDTMHILSADDRLRFDISSNLPGLQPFSAFFPEGVSVEGSSDIHIRVRNNLTDPDFSGSINFNDGILKYPLYGIDFKNIQLSGNLGQMRLLLDSLRMEGGRGFLKMDGFVEIKSMDTLAIKSFKINLQSNRFTVINGPQGEITVNSRLQVQGDSESANFNGNMTIEQGLIQIDAVMSQFGMVADDPNPPLLLEAIHNSREPNQPDSMVINESIGMEHLSFENLRGEFDIDIPGNFWIRGKDMNFELGGNLRAIADRGQLDLFGLLDIRRGHYQVYGKRLVVHTGKIELTGGSEINPVLDVEIGYAFRDDEKQLRNLTVGVTGRALQPAITFQIDGERIDEKDGISYLIFGKSTAELTQGEQSSVDYNLEDIGKSLVLGQLSGLVQGALQSSLGLDVVDIEGSDNWSKGSVTIGKYIARNLFLSYSREFSMDRKSKISHPDNISLEYQILKWLYLQAVSQGTNSGFDLILQKKWK